LLAEFVLVASHLFPESHSFGSFIATVAAQEKGTTVFVTITIPYIKSDPGKKA
jgi:hypothetical protein